MRATLRKDLTHRHARITVSFEIMGNSGNKRLNCCGGAERREDLQLFFTQADLFIIKNYLLHVCSVSKTTDPRLKASKPYSEYGAAHFYTLAKKCVKFRKDFVRRGSRSANVVPSIAPNFPSSRSSAPERRSLLMTQSPTLDARRASVFHCHAE